MSDRRLLTIEMDATSADRGGVFALDPADATSVAIPAIRMVDALPTKGTIKGETVALESDNSLYTWRGGAWTRLVGVGGTNCPVGAITTWPTVTPPPGWLICDGNPFDPLVYPELARVLGKNTTPDLTDEFLRGARNAQDVGVKAAWSTAFKNAMKTTQGGGHNHGGNTQQSAAQTATTTMIGSHHQHWYTDPRIGSTTEGVSAGGGSGRAHPKADGGKTWTNNADTGDNGAHTHTVVLPAHAHGLNDQPDHEHALRGGDAETAPKHTRYYFIICASSSAGVSALQHTFLQAPVADAAALPMNGNTNGDVRITLDNTHMHVWHDGAQPGTGTWNDIGPTNGLTIPSIAGLTDDRDLVFNHTTGAIEWRPLAHELPIPAQATAGWLPRVNAAGTAYELFQGLMWRLPAATATALPKTGNTLGQAAVTLDDGHVHIWQAGAGVPDPGSLARVNIVNVGGGVYTVEFVVEGNIPLTAGVQVTVDLEFTPGGVYHAIAQGNIGQSADQLAASWAAIAALSVNRADFTVAGNIVTITQHTGQVLSGVTLASVTGAGWFDPTTPGWHDVTAAGAIPVATHTVLGGVKAGLRPAGQFVSDIGGDGTLLYSKIQDADYQNKGAARFATAQETAQGAVQLAVDPLNLQQELAAWANAYDAKSAADFATLATGLTQDMQAADAHLSAQIAQTVAHIENQINAVTGALVFKGLVDVTTAAPPAHPKDGWVVINLVAGQPAAAWNMPPGPDVGEGQQVIFENGAWIPLTGTAIPMASTTAAGIVRLATDAEATAGALKTVAVTPGHLPHWTGAATTPVKFWRGDAAAYAAIATPDPDTIYVVTP